MDVYIIQLACPLYNVCMCYRYFDITLFNNLYLHYIVQYLLTIQFHYLIQTVILDPFVLVGVTLDHKHWRTQC